VRQLIGIALVDVVGYSRLMAEDEEGTLEAWRDLRALIDPIFEAGGARIVKSTGDGMLIAATSVIELVRSGVRALEIAAEWNRHRAAGRELRLRIGVNLGDVIVDEAGDIHGDGVNVAARLEGVADPGTVCMSDAVYQQVRGRVEAPFINRGMHRVKNLPAPIHVWAIAPGLLGYHPSKGTRSGPKRSVAAVSVLAVVVLGIVAIMARSDRAGPGGTSTSAPGADRDLSSSLGGVWNVEFGSSVTALTAVGDTLIVVLAEGVVEALDSNGVRLWMEPFDPDPSDSDRSVVVVPYVDLVYVGASDSRVVRAIDIDNGDETWRALLSLDFESGDQQAAGSPRLAVSGEALYVGYGLGVTKLNALTGEEEWTRPVVASLPIDVVAADDSLLVVGDGRFLQGVDPDDGRLGWLLGPPRLQNGAACVQVFTVSVDIGFGGSIESRVIAVSGDRRELLMLDGRTGSVVWSAPVSGLPVIIDDALVVTGVDGELVAYSAASGSALWSRSDLHPSPGFMVDDGRLLVVVGSDLLALNPRSGTTLASTSLDRTPTGSAALAADVIAFPIGATLVAVSPPG
jgi:class 3 adenylate cyclase/outer membrane protein assembly factor BamB